MNLYENTFLLRVNTHMLLSACSFSVELITSHFCTVIICEEVCQAGVFISSIWQPKLISERPLCSLLSCVKDMVPSLNM